MFIYTIKEEFKLLIRYNEFGSFILLRFVQVFFFFFTLYLLVFLTDPKKQSLFGMFSICEVSLENAKLKLISMQIMRRNVY